MLNQEISNKTLLVIDDDADIREALKTVLEEEGYNVVMAVNGEEGLKKLKATSGTCLILLDMMMPVMNGKKFIEALLSDRKLKSIPIIVVSATADQACSQGAVELIKKPFNLHQLITSVARHSESLLRH